jgi:hypothetical protein
MLLCVLASKCKEQKKWCRNLPDENAKNGKKYLTEAGFEPAPEDQYLKLAP